MGKPSGHRRVRAAAACRRNRRGESCGVARRTEAQLHLGRVVVDSHDDRLRALLAERAARFATPVPSVVGIAREGAELGQAPTRVRAGVPEVGFEPVLANHAGEDVDVVGLGQVPRHVDRVLVDERRVRRPRHRALDRRDRVVEEPGRTFRIPPVDREDAGRRQPQDETRPLGVGLLGEGEQEVGRVERGHDPVDDVAQERRGQHLERLVRIGRESWHRARARRRGRPPRRRTGPAPSPGATARRARTPPSPRDPPRGTWRPPPRTGRRLWPSGRSPRAIRTRTRRGCRASPTPRRVSPACRRRSDVDPRARLRRRSAAPGTRRRRPGYRVLRAPRGRVSRARTRGPTPTARSRRSGRNHRRARSASCHRSATPSIGTATELATKSAAASSPSEAARPRAARSAATSTRSGSAST